METNIIITQCDVCGRKIKNRYLYLHENHDWHKYHYYKDWTSGAHKGRTNVEITVCNKCDSTRKGIKYFFHNYIKEK